MASKKLDPKSIDSILSELNCSVDDLLSVLSKYKVKSKEKPPNKTIERLRKRNKSKNKSVKLYRKIINKYIRLRPTSKKLKRVPKELKAVFKEKNEPIRNQLKESIGLLRNKKKDGAIVPPMLPLFEEKESPCGFIGQILNDIISVATYEVEDVNSVPQIKCEECDISFNPEEPEEDVQIPEEDTQVIGHILDDKAPREVYTDEPVAHCSKSPTIYLYPSSLFPPPKIVGASISEVKTEVGVSEIAFNDNSGGSSFDVNDRIDDVIESTSNSLDTNSTSMDINGKLDDVMEGTISDVTESTVSDSNPKNGAAFVSDALDEYLHDDCHLLKISYEVPQLTVESSSDINDNTVLTPQLHGVRSSGVRKKKPESAIKVKTVAEKRKFLEMTGLATSSQTPQEPQPVTRLGVLYYNKKKLWIPVKNTRRPIIQIDFYDYKVPRVFKIVPPLEKKLSQPVLKKPRLWMSPRKSLGNSTKYFPGPLCMKTQLEQLEDQTDFKHWRTVIKKLPKISLEVTPLLGRKVHPKVRHFLPTSGKDSHISMSEERVDFALSVLVANGKPFPPRETHTFHIPYAKNQQHFIAKRKVDVMSLLVPKIPAVTKEEVSDEIKWVVGDMVDFVERKELLGKISIVKEPEVYVDEGKKVTTPKKKTFVKNKTFHEARRLNLRFIKVDGIDNSEEQTCNNSYCTLGCVCSSLNCVQVLAMHCGRVECMFECTCGFNDSNLNALSDLSMGTVTNVSNVPKKALAKEEEEFMQTVIQGDNKTIVVAPGGRERSRRSIKVPKKYDDSFVGLGLLSLEYCTDVETLKKFALTRKVSVTLDKIDLSNIIPYCMVHETHNCQCLPEEVLVKVRKTQPRLKPTIARSNTVKAATTQTQTNLMSLFRSQWYYNFHRDSTARTRGFLYFEDDFLECLRKRNKNPAYLHAIAKKVATEGGELVQIKDLDVEVTGVKKRKRKQSLEVREEPVVTDDEEKKTSNNNYYQNEYAYAIQRRKTKMRKTATPVELFDKIFEDAGIMSKIFSPNEFLKSHLVKILPMCPPNSEFRLVPWETLMKCYTTEKLQFWFTENPISTKVLVTDRTERPSKKCVSFKLFEGVANKMELEVDIIHWIVNRKIPKNKTAENVVIILCFFDPYWEMVGIFEKVGPINNESNECLSAMFMPTSLNGHEYNIQDLSAPSEKKNCTNFYYTDVDDNEKTTTITSKEFPLINLQCNFDEKAAPFLRSLVKESFLDSDNKIIISAHLPESRKECKWRILCLDANFTYLYFNRNCFSIQCKDLGVLLKQSHNESKTVTLHVQSDEDRKYPHYKFGVYASPNCKDAVFIGPYYLNEQHDYELLQHIGGDLVNVDIIMPSEGKINLKKGIWFHKYTPPIDLEETNVEKPSIIKSRLKNLLQMYKQKDPSENDQREPTDTEEKIEEPPPPSKEMETSTNSNDLIVEVDDQNETQYFFITNVSVLGYIRADKSTSGKLIFYMYNERFVCQTVAEAITKIQTKLLETLTPVPSTFKLIVFQVDKEVVKNYKVLEPRYLRVPHLVGEFGVIKLTNNNLSMVKSMTGISDTEEITIKKTSHTAGKLQEMKQNFGSPTSPTKQTTTGGGVFDVLANAIDVIKNLEETERELSAIKKQLEAEKVARTGRLLNMICRLPKEKQAVAKEEMKKILQLYLAPRPIEKFSDSCTTPKSTEVTNKKLPTVDSTGESAPEKRQSLIKPRQTTSVAPPKQTSFLSGAPQKSVLISSAMNPPSLVPIVKTLPQMGATKKTKPFNSYINTLQQNNVVISTTKPTNAANKPKSSLTIITAPKEPPKLIRIRGNNDKTMILNTTNNKVNEIPVYNILKPNSSKTLDDSALKTKVFSTINSIRKRVTDEIEITATASSKNREETVVVNGTKGIENRGDFVSNFPKAVIIDSKGQPVNVLPKKNVQTAQVLVKADVFKNDKPVSLLKNDISKDVTIKPTDLVPGVNNNSDTNSSDSNKQEKPSSELPDPNTFMMDLNSTPSIFGQPVIILPNMGDSANATVTSSDQNAFMLQQLPLIGGQSYVAVQRAGKFLRPILPKGGIIEEPQVNPNIYGKPQKTYEQYLKKSQLNPSVPEKTSVNLSVGEKTPENLSVVEDTPVNKSDGETTPENTSESAPPNPTVAEEPEETPPNASASEQTPESAITENKQNTTPKIAKVPRLVKLTSDTGENLGSVSLLKPAIIKLKKGSNKKRKYLLLTKPMLVKDTNFLGEYRLL